jgi:hypothetical protein
MSDTPTPKDRMCRDKKRYLSEERAIRAALGSSKGFGKAMRWYKCPICRAWHVTSSVR